MGKVYKIKGTEEQTIASAANIAVTVKESVNVVNIALTAATTIILDAASKCVPGQRVIFKIGSDGTGRNATFSTGFTGPVLAGTANKTKTQEFVYTASAGFVAVGSPIQLD